MVSREYSNRATPHGLSLICLGEFQSGALDENTVENVETHLVVNMDNGRTLDFLNHLEREETFSENQRILREKSVLKTNFAGRIRIGLQLLRTLGPISPYRAWHPLPLLKKWKIIERKYS